MAAETLIGYNNVKTGTGDYFYVMKSSSHGDSNTVINYERELLNIDRHMNMAAGVFTAPTDGLYLFHAKGRSIKGSNNSIAIRVNGTIIAQTQNKRMPKCQSSRL